MTLTNNEIVSDHSQGLHKGVVVVGCPMCKFDSGKTEGEKIAANEISEWWFEKAQEELDRTLPKAKEYGSGDLEVMAAALRLLLPADRRQSLPISFYMEWACAFYALGKVARVITAYTRGDRPSDDNWFDLGVYCRIAQRIRDTGEWV